MLHHRHPLKSELPRGVENESVQSGTTAFNAGLDDRDVFLGARRCVVCGLNAPLERCHIVGPWDVGGGFVLCANELNVWERPLHLLFSGNHSNGWDGPLWASKSNLGMKPVMH